MHSILILKQWRHSDQHYIHVRFGHAVFIKKHFGTSSVISDQAALYMCSLLSVICGHLFCETVTFEIYIILCQYSFHSFILGSKTKNTFGEINIFDCNFLSSSYGNESHKSVGYVIVIPWVVRMYVEIIHEL